VSAKRKPGRPPRAAKASLDRVEIRVTKAELLAWQRRAKNNGAMTLSDWLRWCVANAPDA
jgi:hypothetical protein